MRSFLPTFALTILVAAAAAQPGDGIPAGPTPSSPQEYPVLWKNIAQRDDMALREASVLKVYGMLASDDASERREALQALAETTAVPFDREPFEPLVRGALRDEEPACRAFALRILKRFGGTQEDLARVAKLADDENYYVRAGVTHTLYQLDPTGSLEVTETTLLKLLADENLHVLRETCRSLWSMPTTAAVDASLVELTNDPERRSDVLYFALSTRPLMGEQVVAQLVHLADSDDIPAESRSRAVWGLTHSRHTTEARSAAAAAMKRWATDAPFPGMREDAVWGLATMGGDDVVGAVRAAMNDENEGVRREATRALVRLGADS